MKPHLYFLACSSLGELRKTEEAVEAPPVPARVDDYVGLPTIPAPQGIQLPSIPEVPAIDAFSVPNAQDTLEFVDSSNCSDDDVKTVIEAPIADAPIINVNGEDTAPTEPLGDLNLNGNVVAEPMPNHEASECVVLALSDAGEPASSKNGPLKRVKSVISKIFKRIFQKSKKGAVRHVN